MGVVQSRQSQRSASGRLHAHQLWIECPQNRLFIGEYGAAQAHDGEHDARSDADEPMRLVPDVAPGHGSAQRRTRL